MSTSRRTERPLILIPADLRDAVKTDCNDQMLAATFSCRRALTQRLRDTRSPSGCRQPLADRPTDAVADLLECDVDIVTVVRLANRWLSGTQRMIDYASARRAALGFDPQNTGGRAA